jgi:hypothetical protein
LKIEKRGGAPSFYLSEEDAVETEITRFLSFLMVYYAMREAFYQIRLARGSRMRSDSEMASLWQPARQTPQP